MRKNKKAIWVLLPVVLGLWGLIAFRVSKAVGGDKQLPAVAVATATVAKATEPKEVYELELDYADPFLKGRRPVVQKTVPKPKSTPKKPVVKKTVKPIPLRWPDIKYHGLIGSEKGGSTVILNVGGESWFMSAGELKNELKLLKVHEDSVVVEFQGKEKRTYHKGR